jgi:hypothetical protein
MIISIILSVLVLLYALHLLNTTAWDISGIPQWIAGQALVFGILVFWIGWAVKSFIK